MPSDFWNSFTASCVALPNSPSTVSLHPYQLRNDCRFLTAMPSEPYFNVGTGMTPVYLPVGLGSGFVSPSACAKQ